MISRKIEFVTWDGIELDAVSILSIGVAYA